ncbi:Branched-chain amino acid ABC transporter, permease protein LivM (TC 3.A.1.4.1) [Olavius algarvensis Delta 1 endosymbiont]|nr:Branched-chain amino acid ABC transporter, permease protein LivM (TC 3.A.1.4.1) [Olavius algarvensis Delta 1 endosymbiont]
MNQDQSPWRYAVNIGIVGALTAVMLSLIGMVEAFNKRDIIYQIVTMANILLLLTAIFLSYLSASKTGREQKGQIFGSAILTAVMTAAGIALLVAIGKSINLRMMFINASPSLYQILTFYYGPKLGIPLLLLGGVLSGIFSSLLYLAPALIRKMLITALSCVVIAGILQDMLRPVISLWGPLARINLFLYAPNGLALKGAIGLFVLVAIIVFLWNRKSGSVKTKVEGLPASQQRTIKVASGLVIVFVLLILPKILGLFLSEVLTIVGLYVLLGLGLNIVVGFAGLLDLGYVAFFAVGSYVVAVLTSPELGFFNLSFWSALPIVVVAGVLSGVLLGVPVLKMRGDYLAIATLGFGEIIRILVLSDWLRPWIGGAQGIGQIPNINLFGYTFATPQQIYYFILAGCLLVGFISWRLRDSRLGRAWMAVREDEDVAQAMGINLVATKLMAFATGAGFSALSGAIFATKIGSVYPHSFNVIVSINIICLIIVGGMGSIPGVIVGSFALVGLPELLREFAEYRLLVYGAALVAMMLLKPEGLWPDVKRSRELHLDKEEDENGTEAARTATASS